MNFSNQDESLLGNEIFHCLVDSKTFVNANKNIFVCLKNSLLGSDILHCPVDSIPSIKIKMDCRLCQSTLNTWGHFMYIFLGTPSTYYVMLKSEAHQLNSAGPRS